MCPALVWSLWTDGGLIDLIKMKAIDSVMNLQHHIYIIQKAELHSTDINGNSAPCSAPLVCAHTHTHLYQPDCRNAHKINAYQAVRCQHRQITCDTHLKHV